MTMSNFSERKRDGQFQSLLDTVERLRKEHSSQLDASVVREVLSLHADAAAADTELSRSVEQTVERYLAKDS